MKRWSLKFKFGVYAASLATAALAVGASILIPVTRYRQLSELDAQLGQDAGEFFRDLVNFRGAPINPRHPLSAKFVPLSLEDRYILLKGPEGQILYKSPKLQGLALPESSERIFTATVGGRPLRIGTFDHDPYYLRVGVDMRPIDELQNDLLTGIAIAAPFTALVVFIGGFYLGKRAVAPVSEMTAAAERISVNRLDERLPMPLSRDEIARLTEVLNNAFDRLKRAYEAATRFSADASHQLKTPIAVLRLGIESLRKDPDVSETLGSELDALLQQTRRLTGLTNDLLLLAQADAGRLALETEPLNISKLVSAAIDDVEAVAFDKRINVERHLPEGLTITADRRRLSLALQILCENAGKYTPENGSIRIVAEARGGSFSLEIANTGNPIPAADREAIFERFRRGSGVGENVTGHGLGLNIAQTLLQAHGGGLILARSDERWTVFKLSIPIS